jgi:hypothetical protein
MKENFQMSEKTASSPKMNGIILIAIGLTSLIAGAAIVYIPGAPMRGSGIGTLLILLGVALLAIAYSRFYRKRL